MNLDIFNKREKSNKEDNGFIKNFLDELKNALTNDVNEYEIFEKKKIFLDNKTRKGNDIVWIMDDHSVCLSENGDGGPIAKTEVTLPEDAKVGEVYEKRNGEYVRNEELEKEINNIK